MLILISIGLTQPTFPFQQLFVWSLLADPAILQDDDVVAERQVGDAVGD